MDDNLLRQELAKRFSGVLKHDNAAVSFLQLLANEARYVGQHQSDHWSGPFAALGEDFASLKGQEETTRRAVSIWEEDEATGDFVRAHKHVDLWRFCANVERIGRKQDGRKRVVLLGESVARGFFFDPVYSPAKVLQAQLSHGADAVEIVDLAQSNCDPWWLSKTAASTPLLEPDAVVIFAGNNWRVGSLASTSLESFVLDGELIAEERGFAKLLDKQLERLEAFATQVVTQLASLVAKGIPVVFVIPEINVADWTNAPAGALDVPLMSADDTRAWVSAYRGAAAALERGAHAEAEQRIAEAIALDGGTSSASLDLLARAQRSQPGRHRDAYRTLRRSRDIIDETRVVPSVFVTVADAIRRTAPQHGATVVDLPQLFDAYYEHEIPGRRLYLDFCHHTSEGIRVAMAATSQKLLRILFDREAELGHLVDIAPRPAPADEAWAHILAGIHNAHWGQDPEIAAHHFKRAVELDPAIVDTGLPLVYHAYRRKTPPVLLPEFDQLVRNDIAEVCLIGYSPLARGIIKELPMLQAIAAAHPPFAQISPDPDLSVGEVPEIDLLQSHWAELTDRNRWYRRSYAAAYGTRSRFTFASTASQDLSIDVTSRIPGALDTGEIVVALNGETIARGQVDGQWGALRALASAQLVKPGINEVTITWPDVPLDDQRERVKLDFEAGGKVDVRTHFGQLHDLRVSVAA